MSEQEPHSAPKKRGRFARAANVIPPVTETRRGVSALGSILRSFWHAGRTSVLLLRAHFNRSRADVPPAAPGELPDGMVWPDEDDVPHLARGARVAWGTGVMLAAFGFAFLVAWIAMDDLSFFIRLNIGVSGTGLFAVGFVFALSSSRDAHSMWDRYYYPLATVARTPRLWLPLRRSHARRLPPPGP
jgi:hypothetical protein